MTIKRHKFPLFDLFQTTLEIELNSHTKPHGRKNLIRIKKKNIFITKLQKQFSSKTSADKFEIKAKIIR